MMGWVALCGASLASCTERDRHEYDCADCAAVVRAEMAKEPPPYPVH